MQTRIRTLSALMVAAGLLTGATFAQAESTYNGLKPS